MNDDDLEATVFVVDDDVDMADTYALWLEQDGYDVWTAYDGDEALERLSREIDVLILDRRMPSVPGDEILRAAREREGSYQVSMVTAIEPDESIVDLPFDEYLTKPITREELLDTVERLLVRDSLDDNLTELFRLTSKLGTLETRSETDLDHTRPELEAEIQALRDAVNRKVERLDDPEDIVSLIDESGDASSIVDDSGTILPSTDRTE